MEDTTETEVQLNDSFEEKHSAVVNQTEALQQALQNIQARFIEMSANLTSRLVEMGNRVNEIESTMEQVMKDCGGEFTSNSAIAAESENMPAIDVTLTNGHDSTTPASDSSSKC